MTKRLLQTWRTWVTYFVMALAPIGMAVVCGVVLDLIESLADPDAPEPLVVTLEDYPDNVFYLQEDLLGIDDIDFNSHLQSLVCKCWLRTPAST